MRNLLILLGLFTFNTIILAQELNCKVTVIAKLTGNENNAVFNNLERQLNEFINNTKWTNTELLPQERINCNMVLTINNYQNDNFSAGLQISATRPVYNSTYTTTTYNYNDKSFNFKYLEFQNLIYNAQQFESNLISVFAFHVYLILATDADTFKLNGGDAYYKQAQTIANYSQQLAGQGWRLEDGLQSRFALITDVTSSTFKEYREALYSFHRLALDTMSDNPENSKLEITKVITSLKQLHNRRPNSFLMRIFFDAKADEIKEILSDGPVIDLSQTVNNLNIIAPIHGQKWRKINF